MLINTEQFQDLDLQGGVHALSQAGWVTGMIQCVPPLQEGRAAGGGLSTPGTHRPARCSYPSGLAQNSPHPGEEELASTSTPAEGSGRPSAPLGVRAPGRDPWGFRWLPESQRVKGSYLPLEVRG